MYIPVSRDWQEGSQQYALLVCRVNSPQSVLIGRKGLNSILWLVCRGKYLPVSSDWQDGSKDTLWLVCRGKYLSVSPDWQEGSEQYTVVGVQGKTAFSHVADAAALMSGHSFFQQSLPGRTDPPRAVMSLLQGLLATVIEVLHFPVSPHFVVQGIPTVDM